MLILARWRDTAHFVDGGIATRIVVLLSRRSVPIQALPAFARRPAILESLLLRAPGSPLVLVPHATTFHAGGWRLAARAQLPASAERSSGKSQKLITHRDARCSGFEFESSPFR